MRCDLDKCENAARLYPLGFRCAPHAPVQVGGLDTYCAPNRCYCGGCPGYEPIPEHLAIQGRAHLVRLAHERAKKGQGVCVDDCPHHRRAS